MFAGLVVDFGKISFEDLHNQNPYVSQLLQKQFLFHEQKFQETQVKHMKLCHYEIYIG